MSSSSGGGNTAVGSHVVNYPSGIAVGDVLVMGVITDGTSITTPTGFTLRAGPTTNPTSGGRTALYTRTVDGTEGASITVTHGNGPATIVMCAYRGVQEVLDGTAGTATMNGTGVVVTPTLTTATDGSLVIRYAAQNGSSSGPRTWTWPTSTERIDTGFAGPSGSSFTIADLPKAAHGAVGTETATCSLATANGAGGTIALLAA